MAEVNFEELFEKLDVLEASNNNGGGIFGKITIVTSYEVFAKNVDLAVYNDSNEKKITRDDLKFDFDPANEAEKAKAMESAKAMIAKLGMVRSDGTPSSPTACLAFIIRKDAVMNKDVSSWKVDQLRSSYAMFSDDYKNVVKPNLKKAFSACGIPDVKNVTGTWFAHVQYIPSPNKKATSAPAPVSDELAGLEVRAPKEQLIGFIDKIYPNADACKADFSSVATPSVANDPVSALFSTGGYALPANWSVEMIRSIKKDICDDTRPAPVIAKEYDLTSDIVKALKAL